MSLFRIGVSGEAYVKAANASYEDAYEVEFEVKLPLYKETNPTDETSTYKIEPLYGKVLRHVLDPVKNILDKELKKIDVNIKMAKTAKLEYIEYLGPKSEIEYYIEGRKQAINDHYDSFKFKQDGKLTMAQVAERKAELAFLDTERAHIEKMIPTAESKAKAKAKAATVKA